MIPAIEHSDVRELSDEAWLERLKRSISEPVQDGRTWPGFPDEALQKAFVGSAYEHALQEAWNFHRYTLAAMASLARGCRANRYLDFGCGWGRVGRFFLREFERGDMAGVDVDPDMVEFCTRAGVPGYHLPAENGRPLPFRDGAFKLVTAYSVFTHLPEALFRAWLAELLRITAKGGLIVFTVEPPRFLDFVAAIDPEAPETGWHGALAANLGDLGARRRELAERGATYLPTGGGPHRPPEAYGDTVVSPEFIASAAGRLGKLRRYLDEQDRFWQAVAIVQRT
ncbi:MAG: class I SAM-dependent methyltransferase [Proteobacteria bacterium]|nr:class I SAM-dependent methyltransferase [Pseudomonadota bacterium]